MLKNVASLCTIDVFQMLLGISSCHIPVASWAFHRSQYLSLVIVTVI